MKKSLVIVAFLSIASLLLNSCTDKQSSTQTNKETPKQVLAIEVAEINYLEIGKDLAIQTKSSLGKHLTNAIAEKGSAGAVEFCNIKAITITDSMSMVLDAKIKRVSDKPRNQNNTANEAEFAYIQKWKQAKANGEQQPPIVTEIDGKMVGYYPIVTNQMCLQCHGKPDVDINTATLEKIKKLYPTDQAIGYLDNEIRGIFVVEMNKK